MGITAKFIATSALLMCASGAFAQVKCTMPNGKTITLQSSSRCAADATKWETLDGQDITPANAPKPVTAPPPAPSAPKKGETYVVQPKQQPPRIDEDVEAVKICQRIERELKLSCMVQKYNDVLRIMPQIKVWWSGDAEQAAEMCRSIATIARAATHNGFNPLWTVQIKSKHSIDISLAGCTIRQ